MHFNDWSFHLRVHRQACCLSLVGPAARRWLQMRKAADFGPPDGDWGGCADGPWTVWAGHPGISQIWQSGRPGPAREDALPALVGILDALFWQQARPRTADMTILGLAALVAALAVRLLLKRDGTGASKGWYGWVRTSRTGRPGEPTGTLEAAQVATGRYRPRQRGHLRYLPIPPHTSPGLAVPAITYFAHPWMARPNRA